MGSTDLFEKSREELVEISFRASRDFSIRRFARRGGFTIP